MFLKFYVLVALVASSDCVYQTRQRLGYRQNSASGSATGGRQRTRGCSSPRLANGFVVPLQKGKMMRFDCNKGYSRLGERYAECQSGRWSIYTFPICIKAGCPIITTPDNGKITYLNSKASAMLFCEPNYESVGSSFAHCNGSHWDRVIGTCRETDNGPQMSCDFESENLCGWMHDTDHEVDFERRSGYNNKTIAMATGPHADHTTGIPFQGHYMVMNTNTEVSTKRARLISPLYKVNATTMCFSFYYHMYGIGVGTLRVYMKPESVDMPDILREDTEVEANNEFVVFELSSSQGNSWLKASRHLTPINESFQIVIETVSGYTRNSDIAIDDVSLQIDEECDQSDEDAKAPETSEDDDGVFIVESCVNRCFEDKNSTVQLSANHTLSCSCALDCEPRVSCCPDFLDVCMKDPSTTSSTTAKISPTSVQTPVAKLTTVEAFTESPTNATTLTTTTKSMTNKESTSSTVKVRSIAPSPTRLVTSPTPPQAIPPTKTNSNVPQNTSKFNQTRVNETKASDTPKDYEEVADEHEVSEEPDSQPIGAYETDNFVNEKYMMKATENNDTFDISFIIKVSIVSILIICISFIAIVAAYHQYKKSTDPLNYKEKNENASAKANEEFSEIRYLTSDETLDFNLATLDTATEL